MTNDYTQEMRIWLANNLKARRTALVVEDFTTQFGVPFNRNMLAGLMHKAGGKDMFIEIYAEKKKPKPKQPRKPRAKPVAKAIEKPVEVPAPAQSTLPDSELLIIARALMWWEPTVGKDPYVVAARDVNKSRGVAAANKAIDRDRVEAFVRKAGGVQKFLLSVPGFMATLANPDTMTKNAEDKIRMLFVLQN